MVGGGLAIPVTLVGSVALLLVLLRYTSINLIPSDQNNIRKVSMGVGALLTNTYITGA